MTTDRQKQIYLVLNKMSTYCVLYFNNSLDFKSICNNYMPTIPLIFF